MGSFLERARKALKPYQKLFERFVFPVALVLYPFIGALQGIDVTDTAYSLGNYQYMENVDPMWVIATYLPQMTGRFFMRLPYGDTLAGMNLYCTLPVILTALSAYILLQRFLPAWMIFIGVWIAESLCWTPRVILYNYMTYLFFSLGVLLLIHALTDEKPGKWKFFAAGFCLGMNVTVRMPNVTEALMITAVFFWGKLTRRSGLRVLKETMLCIGGYFTGFLIPFITICIRFGSYAYAEMIQDLFSMSETAQDYSIAGMVVTTARAYGRTLGYMTIMIPCMAAGVAMFLLFRDRYVTLKRCLYVAGILILGRFYFARGVFTLNYWYYDCMFQAAMMWIIVSILLFFADCAGLIRASRPDRLLSFVSLLMILLLPLGSNNYTFPVLNCLFLIAPASLGVFRRALRLARLSDYGRQQFVWTSMAFAILALLTVQGTGFHLRYAFRDGMTDGVPRTARITEIPKLNGMATTAENAERLTGLYRFLSAEAPEEDTVILFGDIPGISYLMDLRPAIFTTWPDLESNETERLDEALNRLEGTPLVITHDSDSGYPHAERKYNLLLMFMDRVGYETVYNDGYFIVYRHTPDAVGIDGSGEGE